MLINILKINFIVPLSDKIIIVAKIDIHNHQTYIHFLFCLYVDLFLNKSMKLPIRVCLKYSFLNGI